MKKTKTTARESQTSSADNSKRETVNETITLHEVIYGDFRRQGMISQSLKTTMKQTPNWDMMYDFQREGLEFIANKLSRLLNGDPHFYDTWHDIAGYAKLVADKIQEIQCQQLLSRNKPTQLTPTKSKKG